MTVIVGLEHEGKVYVGGDSQVTSGNGGKYTLSQRKVFRIDDFLIGVAGNWRAGNLLELYLPPLLEIYKESSSDVDWPKLSVEHRVFMLACQFRDILMDNGVVADSRGCVDCEFIVGHKGELYTVNCDFAVMRMSCGYTAIGSGSQFAMGALATFEQLRYRISDPSTVEHKIIDVLEITGALCNEVGSPYYVEVI